LRPFDMTRHIASPTAMTGLYQHLHGLFEQE
jgi:hypothetical protein